MEIMIEEDEDLTEIDPEDDLMESRVIGPRIIILRDPGKTQILGIVKGESDDSILVSYSSVFALNSETETIELSPFFKTMPSFRLFKSEVGIMTLMPEPISKVYNDFIVSTWAKMFPDYFEDISEQIEITGTTRKAIMSEPEEGLDAYLEKAGIELRTPPGSETVQ